MTRTTTVVLASSVAIIVGFAGMRAHYASQSSERLRAVRSDPMSMYLPPSAKVSESRIERVGRITEISRSLGSCDRACYESIIAEAKRGGWMIDDHDNEWDVLGRPVPNGYLVLTVLQHDPRLADTVLVRLRLYEGGFRI
jgi:hypothetical protein